MKARASSIAIVGGGAAGIATLNHLVQEYRALGLEQDINISIFEKRPDIGAGFAYQEDGEVLLMNQACQYLSLYPENPTHFWDWLVDYQPNSSQKHTFAHSSLAPDGFVTRRLFGRYLRDAFAQICALASDAGVEVTSHHTEVTRISHSDGKYTLTSAAITRRFDYVILCTGNASPADIYNLALHPRYIHDPYPIRHFKDQIEPQHRVAILGTQLTAADVAISLVHHGHTGPITMLSRTGELPAVRSLLKPHTLKVITREALAKIRATKPQGLQIRDVLRLLRKELLTVGWAWREVFFASHTASPEDYFGNALKKSTSYQEWQFVVVTTDEILEDYWHALSDTEQKRFMDSYHRVWNSRRAPLPVITAYKIHALLRAKQLTITKNTRSIAPESSMAIQVQYSDPGTATQTFDWVINTTGPNRHVGTPYDTKLIKSLLDDGLVTRNELGGVVIDFDSSEVKNPPGNMYAVGHLACGTYYYVSSLNMVANRAGSTAKHLLQRLEKNSRMVNQ